MSKILQNGVEDQSTGKIYISSNRWDFQYVSGNEYHIDGGLDYIKRGGTPPENVRDISLTTADSLDDICDKLCWGTRGYDGTDELQYKFIKDLDVKHLEALMKYNKKNPISVIHFAVMQYWLTEKKAL